MYRCLAALTLLVVLPSTDSAGVAGCTDGNHDGLDNGTIAMLEGRLCLPGSIRRITFAQISEGLGFELTREYNHTLLLPIPPGEWSSLKVDALLNVIVPDSEEYTKEGILQLQVDDTITVLNVSETTMNKTVIVNVDLPPSAAFAFPIDLNVKDVYTGDDGNHHDKHEDDSDVCRVYLETLSLQAVDHTGRPCEEPEPCTRVIEKEFYLLSPWMLDSLTLTTGIDAYKAMKFKTTEPSDLARLHGYVHSLWSLNTTGSAEEILEEEGLVLYIPELDNTNMTTNVTSFSVDIMCNTMKNDTTWRLQTVNANQCSGLNPSFTFRCNHPTGNGWIPIPYPVIMDDQQRNGIVGLLENVNPAHPDQVTPRASGPTAIRIRPEHCSVDSDQKHGNALPHDKNSQKLWSSPSSWFAART